MKVQHNTPKTGSIDELTHEARRYCHGDGEWSNWQACTEKQALKWRFSEHKFEVRERAAETAQST